KMQGARFTVRGSRIKNLAMADADIGPFRWWGEMVPRIARVCGRCAGGQTPQSARRLVDAGRSVNAAVLAAQPLAEVGDLEALAQMVCKLAREQQATMFATLADGDEGGFAADQRSQGFVCFGLSRVAVAGPHVLGRFHG